MWKMWINMWKTCGLLVDNREKSRKYKGETDKKDINKFLLEKMKGTCI